MNLKLIRKDARQSGVFGVLLNDTGGQIATTLEHSYPKGKGWTAKVAPGTYKCVRHAPNRLPYETFMLENVPDFQGKPVSGILLHIGNYDDDSEGCILVGQAALGDMITHSRVTFNKLMDLQKGLDSFQLTISNS